MSVGVALVVLVLAGGCVAVEDGGPVVPSPSESSVAAPEPEPSPSVSPKPDVLAVAACRHFYNVMSDVSDGLLDDEELRTKLQEVRADGQLADEPGVPEASDALVAATTGGVDEPALVDAIEEMDAACSAL